MDGYNADQKPEVSLRVGGSFKQIIQIAGLILCLLWLAYSIYERLAVPDEYASVAGIVLPLSLAALIALNLFQNSSHAIIGASLGLQEYTLISAPEIEQRVWRRYHAQFDQLGTMGFNRLFDFGQSFPLIRLLFILPAMIAVLMWLHREVISIKDGKFISIHPVFAASDQSALAHTFGLGAKFYTAFDDGTLLVSKSFKDRPPDNPGTMKHGKGGDIATTWAAHQDRVRQLQAQGKSIDRKTDFEFYTEIIGRG